MFDVENFIEAVKTRSALYDHNHKNYNRKFVRGRLWDEIGQIMYSDWRGLDARDRNEKVTFMQKKWKSLKDCFNREIRQQKTRDPKKLHKRYEFYDRLSFLLQEKVVPPSKTPGPAKEKKLKETVEDDVVEVKTAIGQFESSVPQLVGNKIKDSSPVPYMSLRKRKWTEEDGFLAGKRQRKAEETENSDRLFLMSFVGDLSRLPLATKYWVKMKFSEIMHQAAMSLNGYQDAEYGSTSVDIDQDLGSPANDFVTEYSENNSPDQSFFEIHDVCQN